MTCWPLGDIDEQVAFTRKGEGHKSDCEHGEGSDDEAFGEHGSGSFSFICSVAGVLPQSSDGQQMASVRVSKKAPRQIFFGSKKP